jgi:aerobic-type carbon monoxide dehydrogenase small subunit (CoxS/CutS family)
MFLNADIVQGRQIMSAAVLIRENKNPTEKDIDTAMAGNICRCGTYLRIRKAIQLAQRYNVKEDRTHSNRIRDQKISFL